ncbi:cytochrome P450 [Maricaulis sp.]|uniref:cytochrome P450 n=1 Tax=Maricaulis sp. TaxID=1486257 RepID=UPI0025BE7DB2|nr:cytochrome P450 [Maricaulis sp.]
MQLVSDVILEDQPQVAPHFEARYPSLEGFALWDPQAWTNGHPHDFFRRMREEAPVMWQSADPKRAGYWSVSRYDDIKAVELAPEIYSSERGSINMFVMPRNEWKPKKLIPAAFNSIINLDQPQHMQMRIQQKDYFIPRFVAELGERVDAKIDSLLDEMERRGPVVDFVSLFSQELPLFTLCEMLGIDEADRPKIIRWMHYLELANQYFVNPWTLLSRRPWFPIKFYHYVNEMFAYGERVMADRRVNPRPDLMTAIANTRMAGKPLPQEYLDGSWLLIIFAGNDTSRNSLSGTIRLLTEFPDQRARVLADRSLIPAMTNEALRMISPVQHMRRTAMEDTELSGQRIARDEKVVLWYPAANRDPDVFADPDRFDVSRENVDKHIAFGHGPHKCLGNRIAQMQLQRALTKILERFPNIAWTGKQTISPNTLVHAISSLEVNLYGPNGQRPTQVAVSRHLGAKA